MTNPGWRMLGAPEEFDAAPGMLGATAAPAPAPQQQPKDTFWSRLASLFGGGYDPRLTPEQNKAAQQRAMMMAGVGMMAAPGNFGQQLAAGVSAGQAIGQQQREQALSQQQAEEMKSLIGNGEVDENMLRTLFARAIATGQIDIARALSEVLKSLGGVEGSSNVWAMEDVLDPETNRPMNVLYNRKTGEVKPTGYRGMPKTPQLRAVMDPATGVMNYFEWNPATGEWKPTGMSAGSTPNEKQQLAAFMLPLVDIALQPVDDFERAPSRLLDIVAKKNYGEVTPSDYQMLNTAGKVLGDAYLRLTSGAAIKEEEIIMFMTTYLPAPGDTPQTLQFKRNLRKQFRDGLQMLAAKVPGQKATVLGLDGKPKEVTRRDVPVTEFVQGAQADSAAKSFFDANLGGR